MAQRKTLTDGQVALLRWVADGCPDGVIDGVVHRISAAALRSRGLIKTSGRGPTWRAEITVAGREHLERLDGSDPPLPRQTNVSVTQQLVDDLLSAGGSMRVPRKQWRDRTGIDYAHRARLAETHCRVPAGSRLTVSYLPHDELLIQLIGPASDANGDPRGLRPVPVSEQVARHHPAARAFRERVGLHEVSRKVLPRVLRIVHAIATAAERHGYSIRCADAPVLDRWGRGEWKAARDGQLIMTTDGHDIGVRIWEKGCGARGPYEQRMAEWRFDREQPARLTQFIHRPAPYDSAATGELEIEALGPSMGRQRTWGDRKQLQLEDRLPHLMNELELQAAELEDRRLAKERERTERERQWHAAMNEAERRLIEDTRLGILRQRVDDWEYAERIRAYCADVEKQHGEQATDPESDTAAWLAYARADADRLQRLPHMPADPKPTPDRLKPYLGSLSPYGPR